MTATRYRKLKVGDKVTLAVNRNDYSSGHRTPDGRIYVPAGTVGVVGAVRVSNVTGPNGNFACVDFHFRPEFVDCIGRRAEHWQRKDLPQMFRVAASREDLI